MPYTEENKIHVKNYDRELGAINTKINYLEKKFERYEIDNSIKLKEIKEQNDKLEIEFKKNNKDFEIKIDNKFEDLSIKIDGLKNESVFTKGFIKAILICGSIIGVIITVLIKFIK